MKLNFYLKVLYTFKIIFDAYFFKRLIRDRKVMGVAIFIAQTTRIHRIKYLNTIYKLKTYYSDCFAEKAKFLMQCRLFTRSLKCSEKTRDLKPIHFG